VAERSTCPFLHPETCEMYSKFGSKRHDRRGCENTSKKCAFLHPELCRMFLKGKCQKEAGTCHKNHLTCTTSPFKGMQDGGHNQGNKKSPGNKMGPNQRNNPKNPKGKKTLPRKSHGKVNQVPKQSFLDNRGLESQLKKIKETLLPEWTK
jgi:hypothetical protein